MEVPHRIGVHDFWSLHIHPPPPPSLMASSLSPRSNHVDAVAAFSLLPRFNLHYGVHVICGIIRVSIGSAGGSPSPLIPLSAALPGRRGRVICYLSSLVNTPRPTITRVPTLIVQLPNLLRISLYIPVPRKDILSVFLSSRRTPLIFELGTTDELTLADRPRPGLFITQPVYLKIIQKSHRGSLQHTQTRHILQPINFDKWSTPEGPRGPALCSSTKREQQLKEQQSAEPISYTWASAFITDE